DQVHRCCMRVACGVIPSGQPARRTGLLISVMEHPERTRAARPIVPARTPLRAIRRRPPCVTFTPSLPCPTLGVLPEILRSVDHGNQETRTRVVSAGHPPTGTALPEFRRVERPHPTVCGILGS